MNDGLDYIACNACYGQGGLGAALAELVETARARDELAGYFASLSKAGDALGVDISLTQWRRLFCIPPLRYRHAWRDFLAGELFDRAVAAQLGQGDRFIGFNGRALHSFRRARALGYRELALEAGTPHIDLVWRRHREAYKRYPFDQTWVCALTRRKYAQEYEIADTILYQSEYTRQSLIDAGIPERKLQRRTQPVAARFAPPVHRADQPGFVVVSIGRLQVSKGIPVLIEAFGMVDDPSAELILIGGAATDGMERYLKARIAADPRIKIRPGDPLPHLHRADVLVHPSFEDGLALAPLEALACGVPVIVTEDTGMKDSVIEGSNGYIIPTGNAAAIVERINEIRRKPLRGTFPTIHRSAAPR